MKRFLRLFEDSWDCRLHSHLYASAIGSNAFELLCREGVLEPAGQTDRYPCPSGGRHCPRAIVPVPRNKERPFLAVCGDRRSCISVPLTEEQTHLHGLNRRCWVDLLRRLYNLDGPVSYDLPGNFGLWAVGQTRGREVFLSETPDAHDLLQFVLAREAMPRATRIVLPTSTRLDPFLAQRCRASARVEVALLEDELAIADGMLVVTTNVEMPMLPIARHGRSRAFTLPPEASWRDVRVYRVDGHTISARSGSLHKRLTYVDLGMASEKTREPTRAWEMLMALCEGGGTLRWRGDAVTVKRRG